MVAEWGPSGEHLGSLPSHAPALQTPRRRQLLLWALLCPWLRVPRCGRQAPFFTFKAFCFQGVLEDLTLTSWDPSVCVLHNLGTGSGQFGVVGSGGGGGRGRVVCTAVQGGPLTVLTLHRVSEMKDQPLHPEVISQEFATSTFQPARYFSTTWALND